MMLISQIHSSQQVKLDYAPCYPTLPSPPTQALGPRRILPSESLSTVSYFHLSKSPPTTTLCLSLHFSLCPQSHLSPAPALPPPGPLYEAWVLSILVSLTYHNRFNWNHGWGPPSRTDCEGRHTRSVAQSQTWRFNSWTYSMQVHVWMLLSEDMFKAIQATVPIESITDHDGWSVKWKFACHHFKVIWHLQYLQVPHQTPCHSKTSKLLEVRDNHILLWNSHNFFCNKNFFVNGQWKWKKQPFWGTQRFGSRVCYIAAVLPMIKSWENPLSTCATIMFGIFE